MIREMRYYGKKLFELKLLDNNMGNMSVRSGDSLVLTKHGCFLDEINDENVVKVDGSNEEASYDLRIHQEIYRNTECKAIIHSHPVFSVVLSLEGNPITPVDAEGAHFLKEIPVVSGKMNSLELGKRIAAALEKSKGVIVQGHGVYAVGNDLKEAFVTTTLIEHSCKVVYFRKLLA